MRLEILFDREAPFPFISPSYITYRKRQQLRRTGFWSKN